MNQCRKCWKQIADKHKNSPALRCDKCRRLLDILLEKKDIDFDTFFEFYKRNNVEKS